MTFEVFREGFGLDETEVELEIYSLNTTKSATFSEDYETIQINKLFFKIGVLEVSFDVHIIEDELPESSEYFQIQVLFTIRIKFSCYYVIAFIQKKVSIIIIFQDKKCCWRLYCFWECSC